MTETKWDIARLSALSNEILREKEMLAQNKDLLLNINNIVENAFQGYAGRSFDRRMEVDAENIERVVKGIEELSNDLNKVITECYSECEESVRSQIQQLRSKI